MTKTGKWITRIAEVWCACKHASTARHTELRVGAGEFTTQMESCGWHSGRSRRQMMRFWSTNNWRACGGVGKAEMQNERAVMISFRATPPACCSSWLLLVRGCAGTKPSSCTIVALLLLRSWTTDSRFPPSPTAGLAPSLIRSSRLVEESIYPVASWLDWDNFKSPSIRGTGWL